MKVLYELESIKSATRFLKLAIPNKYRNGGH